MDCQIAYQRLRRKPGSLVVSSSPAGLNPEEYIRELSVLEFLNLKDEYSESDLEQALILELERFLLELGTEWYPVDLLFFTRDFDPCLASN